MLFLLFFAVGVASSPCRVQHTTAVAWSVDCSDSDLEYLPENIFKYPIFNLTLRNNKLKNANFSYWKHLEYLDVSFNAIQEIKPSTFNLNLKHLNISYNNLKDVNISNIDNISLEMLDLSGNFLMSDNENVFKIVKKTFETGLKELYANSLGLADFPEYLFLHAHDLVVLSLRNNNLTFLPKFPPSLTRLDLSGNNISELTWHSFHNAVSLKELIIEDNRFLTLIHSDAFHHLKHLEKLSLKGSLRLENLPKSLFYNIPLKSLSLANCNLKTLPPYYKYQFLEMEFLDLHNNPWDCDSSIKWFSRLEPSRIQNLRCAWPYNMTVAEHYGSMLSHTILRNLLAVLIGLVLMFFGLGIWFAWDMEKKRRLDHPYTPLGKQNTINNPVYISTVC